MKKIIATVLAAVAACTTFCFASCGDKKDDTKTLQVYTNAGFAPYEYVNEMGDVVGVDIDIMNYIGKELGYKVVINDIEFNQILVEVGENELAVGAAGMTKKKERDDIALASISYATSVQYVIVPNGSFDEDDLVDGKLPLSKLTELDKKAVGVQTGTTGEFMVDDALLEGQDLFGFNYQKLTYSNAIIASQDIGTTLGAVIIDKLPAQSIANANSALECFELDAEPESYVLYFNKNATELVAQVNTILESMIASGKINEFTLNHSGANK